MSPSTQFHRHIVPFLVAWICLNFVYIGPHRYHSHRVRVHLAENCPQACDSLCQGQSNHLSAYWKVAGDSIIDYLFDISQLLHIQWLLVIKVKSKLVRSNQAAALLNVHLTRFTKNSVQSKVENMGGSVVLTKRATTRLVKGGSHPITKMKLAILQMTNMQDISTESQ